MELLNADEPPPHTIAAYGELAILLKYPPPICAPVDAELIILFPPQMILPATVAPIKLPAAEPPAVPLLPPPPIKHVVHVLSIAFPAPQQIAELVCVVPANFVPEDAPACRLLFMPLPMYEAFPCDVLLFPAPINAFAFPC